MAVQSNNCYSRQQFVRTALFIGMRTAQVAIGIILLWSATEHDKNPQLFLVSILRYEIAATPIAYVLAFSIPTIELTLAIMMIANCSVVFASTSCGILFFAFAAAQLSALLRGLEIGCGCFGPAHQSLITMESISLATLLCIMSFATSMINYFLNRGCR